MTDIKTADAGSSGSISAYVSIRQHTSAYGPHDRHQDSRCGIVRKHLKTLVEV